MPHGLVLAYALTTAAAPTKPSGWQDWPHGDNGGGQSASSKGLYVMTNDVTSNAVVAMALANDGTLSGGSSVATGGKGSNLVDVNQTALFPDALSVQDSVVSAGNVSGYFNDKNANG